MFKAGRRGCQPSARPRRHATASLACVVACDEIGFAKERIARTSEEDGPSKKAVACACVGGAGANLAQGAARLARTVTSPARASSTLARERVGFAIAPAVEDDASAKEEIARTSEDDRPSKKATAPAGVAGARANLAHGPARLARTVTSVARASSFLAHERGSFAIAPAIEEDASAKQEIACASRDDRPSKKAIACAGVAGP
jgi:hypothetical protein